MNIMKVSAYDMSLGLKRGEFASTDLVKAALERIGKTDEKLGAFLHVDHHGAMKAAEQADKRRLEGKQLSVLDGIPVAVKDNICIEGMPCTCASKMLENFHPPYTATVAEKLHDAGCVIIGKTNMDEFAMGSSTENSALGITCNPWDTTRVPGGSSGGSAVSVSASQVPLALGSDTGGSIRQPASFCGVVGIKPTYGRVSRYGLVAFASSLDQIGPLASDVRDAAMLLDIISGHDSRDSTSVDKHEHSYTEHLDMDIRGLKIGLPEEYFVEGMNPGVEKSIRKAVKELEKAGAVIRNVSLPHTKYAVACYYIVAPAEASSNLARFDGVRYGLRTGRDRDISDMISRTRSDGFGPEVKRRIMLGTYALSSGYYDAYYLKALKMRRLIKEDFDRAFEQVDVIIGASTPDIAFAAGSKVDDPLQMYLCDVLTIPVNLAGLPALSMPCGMVDGLPAGLQFIGRAFDESKLLGAAAAYEKIRGPFAGAGDMR